MCTKPPLSPCISVTKSGHNPAVPIGQNLTYSCPEGQGFSDNWHRPPKVTIRCEGAAGNFSKPSSWAWPTCSTRESVVEFQLCIVKADQDIYSNLLHFMTQLMLLHFMTQLMLLHFMMTFSMSSGWWLCFESPFHALAIFRKPLH